jgi:hypothetical protein
MITLYYFLINGVFFISKQGRIGPTGSFAEDLHVLDLTQQLGQWHRLGSLVKDVHAQFFLNVFWDLLIRKY